MTETLKTTLPLTRWRGERGTYHLVIIESEQAEQIAMHARLHRLEFGRQRGFGSVKVVARIGETEWKSSVFPQKASSPEDQAARTLHPSTRSLPETHPGGRVEGAGGWERSTKKSWILLVSKKVMRAENLVESDPVNLELELL